MLLGSIVRLWLACWLVPAFGTVASSQPAGGPTTESICNFGMAKGEPQQSCEIPMMSGCAIAHFPGTTKPWTNISKGGNTSCRFDDKRTDWKTRITGSCTSCRTEHCSARFSVMFDCTAQ